MMAHLIFLLKARKIGANNLFHVEKKTEAWHLFGGNFNSMLILSVLYDVFSSYYKDVVDFNSGV